jgi:hypothetical protein
VYFVRLRARHAGGVSGPSPEQTITIAPPGCQPPLEIASLNAPVTGNSVSLTWNFVIVFTLCALSAVVIVIALPDISHGLSAIRIHPYQQRFGFEVGLVHGWPWGSGGVWGITRVRHDGPMARAGFMAGDVPFQRHGSGAGRLAWALEEFAAGRRACVEVVNVAEAQTLRDVCLQP